MKQTILLITLLGTFVGAANAEGIKLYVGTAEYMDEQSTRFFLQLVVCNNNADTIYIERNDLDNIHPRTTTDASIINDGGSFYLINNVPGFITDEDRLREMVGSYPEERYVQTTLKQQEVYQENNKLPQRELNSVTYYVLPPNKCLTVHCVTQSAIYEFLKLHDVATEQHKSAVVYLTMPVTYITAQDKARRQQLLISRPSDDLKNCVFIKKRKK